MRRTLLRSATVVLTGALVVGGCGSSSDGESDDLTVFAAASLTDAFGALGDAFTEANPDIEVTFNFAASSELVAQVIEGAPADLYASADLANMDKLVAAGAEGDEPVVFATNRSEIIVGPGNPEGIADIHDLARPDLVVVTCAIEVPCGSYAAEVFANAGVTVTPKSYEQNVKAVVTKVTLGEADAGIVYATDVTAAADDASGVVIPDDINVVAEYPIAITGESSNAAGAQTFIDFVLSNEGQAVLASFGFGPP